MRDAAVLWTGGKDCSLAWHEAIRSGYRIRCLATFAPPEARFLAHPLPFLELQAQALGLPHYRILVREPFAQGYERGLQWLRDQIGIRTLITGDIAEVSHAPNWIRACNRGVGLNVLAPLWGTDRFALLQQVLGHGFKAIFSCVNTRWLSEDWVGRRLDGTAIAGLRAARERTGLDLCGEQGEYHTLVTDGPAFQRGIRIRSSSRRVKGSLAYLQIRKMELTTPKNKGRSGEPRPW